MQKDEELLMRQINFEKRYKVILCMDDVQVGGTLVRGWVIFCIVSELYHFLEYRIHLHSIQTGSACCNLKIDYKVRKEKKEPEVPVACNQKLKTTDVSQPKKLQAKKNFNIFWVFYGKMRKRKQQQQQIQKP